MNTVEKKEKQDRLEGNERGGMEHTKFFLQDHYHGLLQSQLISGAPSLIPYLKCIPPAVLL